MNKGLNAMNMKYFCGIAAMITAMLCAVGCGDSDSSSEIYLNTNNGMNVGQSPAAAVGGYIPATKREELVTAGTGGDPNEGDNMGGYDPADYNGPGVADRGGSEWFKAHTLFRMEMNDDESWFKITNIHGDDEYTYTSTVVMFEPIVRTGLLDEQKMPDTLLTKSPAGDGKNVGSGGNKNTAGTSAAKTSVAQAVTTKKAG